MPLPANYYDADLLVDGQLVEVRHVRLVPGDELRAELEGGKRAIPASLPLHLTTLMLWSALVRLGHYAEGYDEFMNGGLVEYRRVDPAELDVDEEPVEVPPTPEAAPSGPVSPSLPTSPASSTGSIPTSTSA